MKVLFAALHLAHFRNFESAIRELAARGHHVHLTADEPEGLGGEDLARRLTVEWPRLVTWDRLPSLDHEPWYDAARRMRVALDYVRALDPQYPPKLRLRAEQRTARVVRWLTTLPGGRTAALRMLTRAERLMPTSAGLLEYVRGLNPDVVVLASLTYSRSQQLDLLKAARTLRIPVSAAIMSWDHLSSKALLHICPDQVIVWNEIQKREAIEMHGVPADRVVVTGAQCYDQWFTRAPERTREEFCGAIGLRADRPFALWVHSALSPAPSPPEPVLVSRWIDALRRSSDPRLRELGVLVRPHPERLKEWTGVTLDADNVAFHGRNPIDREAKNDYFESLYYSSAVVGLVTSAFVEAAVVGRPVLTITLPEYRMHQEEMIHFRYLTSPANVGRVLSDPPAPNVGRVLSDPPAPNVGRVLSDPPPAGGGLLHSAPDLETHLRQLAEALALDGARDARNRGFVEAFVRPGGLDAPATPAFASALEALQRNESPVDPSLNSGGWLRPAVMTAASWSRSGVGRWLMNDMRADAWDDRAEYTEQSLKARRAQKAARIDAKQRRRQRRQRRDALMLKAKEAKSALRTLRFRAAVFAHRLLGRGSQP